MAHLIDKSALVAEIEKLQSEIAEEKKLHEDNSMWYNGINHGFNLTKDILNTLEVKEVDMGFQTFAKEMEIVFALPSSKTKNTEEEPLNWEYAIAKHFFELGMQASNKTQKGE